MSRTHKTKPFWVKMKQGHLATEEIHDHRFGPCDLPAEVERDEWRRRNRCRHSFYYNGVRTCCCGMCRGTWDVRPGQRQRLEGKRYVSHDWDAEYAETEHDEAMRDYYEDLADDEAWFLRGNREG